MKSRHWSSGSGDVAGAASRPAVAALVSELRLDRDACAADTGRAMSQENVDVVRRALESFPRGDVEEMLSYLDPELEWHSAIVGGAEGNVYRGHDGFRTWLADSF